MRFYGSAMRMPHMQGGFREVLVCSEAQAVPIPASLSLELAAFAEPLSVCLHAARQAGPLLGKRVLVTGSGPIGALAMLVARQAGAREVVATDITDAPLAVARQIGADAALNTLSDPEALTRYKADKGYFETVFEASGSAVALAGAMEIIRPGGTVVQLGLSGGEMSLPINILVAKEITLRGTFRFHAEFEWAVDFLASGAIDVAPLLTEIVPLAEAVRAFDLAGDRTRAMKVQLAL
jgi:L-idonate 5-dehydrogenase